MDDSLGVFLDKCRKYHMYDYCFDVQELIQSKYPELSFDEIHELRLGDIWHHIGGLKLTKIQRKEVKDKQSEPTKSRHFLKNTNKTKMS